MSDELKVGDRVRLTADDRVQGYHLGDTGTVRRGPCPLAWGEPYYVVAMDKEPARTGAVYTAGELEAAT